jgi:hypothetical protein
MKSVVRDKLLRKIDSFDGGLVGLGRLIKDLDSVWQGGELSEGSSGEFRRHWSKLEVVYALALERDDGELTAPETGDIRAELVKIRSLIVGPEGQGPAPLRR